MTKERSLVERLRYDVGSRPGGICEEAAREIERLTTALREIAAACGATPPGPFAAGIAAGAPLTYPEPIMTQAKLDAMATLGDPLGGLADEPGASPVSDVCARASHMKDIL